MNEKLTLYEPLKRYFGFDNFKMNQEAIIHSLLEGKNVFVLMPTGGGKSTVLPVAFTYNGRNGYCYFASHRFDEKSG